MSFSHHPKFSGSWLTPFALTRPYLDGNFVHMKKTLHIDEHLLKEARLSCQAHTDTETVRLGLEALVRHAAYERLKRLRGTEPEAEDVPRRRSSRNGARQ